MTARNIPFAVVLLATLMPWPAAFLDAKWATFLPDALLVTLLLTFLVSHHREGAYKPPFAATVVILLLALHSMLALVDGRGIGSGGLILLTLYVVIFRWAMLRSPPERLAHSLFFSISLLYALHVLFLWFELLFRLSGGTGVILELFGQATAVTKYKDYNAANFLWAIGFTHEQITGLNSLLLGSQSASQVAVFAALWFAPLYRIWRGATCYRPMVLFVLAAVMVPVSSSMAAILILIGLLAMLIFMLPYSRIATRQWRILIVATIAVFSGEVLRLAFFRVRGEHDVEEYLRTFSSSVQGFLSLPAYQQWLGFGSNIAQAPHTYADFGYGMLLLQVGIFFFAMLLIAYSVVLLKAFFRLRQVGRRIRVAGPWQFLVLLNLMLSIGWGVSLVHYTPAVELGGRHLFAFHLAALLVSLRHARSQWGSFYMKPSVDGPLSSEAPCRFSPSA